jgi:hypothetical protein
MCDCALRVRSHCDSEKLAAVCPYLSQIVDVCWYLYHLGIFTKYVKTLLLHYLDLAACVDYLRKVNLATTINC